MLWKITTYNGTTWQSGYDIGIIEAIESFFKDTGLCQVDIKSIVNLS